MKKVFCTVLTPTYNRASLLLRLYESLVQQSLQDFEWVIVDDGSNDNTKEVVNNFIRDKKINIKYLYQENGGKHRAINNGLNMAFGKVLAIVDSDDYLEREAIFKIHKGFAAIEEEKKLKYAGVAFQKGYSEEQCVGSFKNDASYIDAKANERVKNNIHGDKFEIFYTKLLIENKFPEFPGEKFMTEAIVWTRIAHLGYYIRWYPDIIYFCNYLPGGLTDTRDRLVSHSPKGYALYIQEQVKYGNINLKQKLGYYSYYAMIRRKNVCLRTIAKELKVNTLVVGLSLILRKLFRKN